MYSKSVEVYDSSRDAWQALVALPPTMAGFTATLLDGNFVTAGGWNEKNRVMKMAFALSMDSYTWVRLPDMVVARRWHSAVECGNKVYVIGGFDGSSRLRTIEVFDPEAADCDEEQLEEGESWLTIAVSTTAGIGDGGVRQSGSTGQGTWTLVDEHMMTEARDSHVSVAIGNKIFVLGGYDGRNRLRSCEVFDTETLDWSPIASMRCARDGHAAVVLDGDIIVSGGYDGRNYLSSCERYIVERNTWEPFLPMAQRRYQHTMSILTACNRHDDCLLVCGGAAEAVNVSFSDCETFSCRSNQWRRACSMTSKRASFAAVTVCDDAWPNQEILKKMRIAAAKQEQKDKRIRKN